MTREMMFGGFIKVTVTIGVLLLYCRVGWVEGLEVHFDDVAAGFFLSEGGVTEEQHEEAKKKAVSSVLDIGPQSGSASPNNASFPSTSPPKNVTELHFTILPSSQVASLRASYGPFLSRTVIPTQKSLLTTEYSSPNNQSISGFNKASVKWPRIELSAHLVTKEVRKDRPILRVLFHTGQRSYRGHIGNNRRTDCIVLTAELKNHTVATTCEPNGKDGTCLGSLVIPSGWWPSLTSANGKSTKHPKIVTTVSYFVFESVTDCSAGIAGKPLAIPVTFVDYVPLSISQNGYRQIGPDELTHMLISQSPLYPGSRLYVPVFFDQPGGPNPVTVIALKCRARRGVSIAGVEAMSDNWTLRTDINNKGTVATVTAFRKNAKMLQNTTEVTDGPEEIFNWLYLIQENDSELWEDGKLSWRIKYQYLSGPASLVPQLANTKEEKGDVRHGKKRIRYTLNINKDDVQSVLPISKRWQIINTAVLTGRQISQPLKIFIVSEAGEIADVTLHTSCHTQDDSALKVSSSCTSVYVDGSETRGALHAEVNVKYGTYSGQGFFTVWMASFPLQVQLQDNKLSQIKAWRVPIDREKKHQKRTAQDGVSKTKSWRDHFERQSKLEKMETKQHQEKISQSSICKLRYQQSRVRVFAKFLAEDPDSGRKEYYISRSTSLDVTDLTKRSLRTTDARVATIKGTTVHAHTTGRTQVEITSPITGHVIGMSDVKVLKNKESIVGLNVRIISGINVNVHPNANQVNKYTLQTYYTNKLTAKYQEGLLDIDILFSDGTVTPLREIDTDHFYLAVDTMDSQAIAFAPVEGSRDTRVIAVGNGNGQLLKSSIELADACHQKEDDPLAQASAHVDVEFSHPGQVDSLSITDFNQKDYRSKPGKRRKKHRPFSPATKSVDMGGLSEMLSNIALGDDNTRDKYDLNLPHKNKEHPRDIYQEVFHHQMSPLEIGMYLLLGVFCVAIAVFMVSCFVYASKHNKQNYVMSRKSQSVQNAHDWVWLGRATLDKSSTHTGGSTGSGESRRQFYDNQSNARNKSYRNSYNGTETNLTRNPMEDDLIVNGAAQVYAELPRRKSPKIYQNQPNSPAMSPKMYKKQPNSPKKRRNQLIISEHSQSNHRQMSKTPQPPESNSNSLTNIEAISPPINSATYTRKTPLYLKESGNIFPVGFPIFGSNQNLNIQFENQPINEFGFHNPWEALELHNNHQQTSPSFFKSTESLEDKSKGLELDLCGSPPHYDLLTRQSPASALPPQSPSHSFFITPQHIQAPLGEYISLNPDINKPSPPRLGGLHFENDDETKLEMILSNPFEVTDDVAPPVMAEKLSPSHIFSIPSYGETTDGWTMADRWTDHHADNTSDGKDDENSSTKSSSQSPGIEEPLPNPHDVLDSSDSDSSNDNNEFNGETSSYDGYPQSHQGDGYADQSDGYPHQSDGYPHQSDGYSQQAVKMVSPTNMSQDELQSIALGNLDYEQLMKYFEGLKESTA